MPNVNSFQTNFSAGEISPRLYGRVDIAKYMNGCHDVHNFIIQRFGGAKKRGGTEFINEVKSSASAVRLIPFVPSITQAYICEFGNQYIRFYTNGGVVTSGGSPVEIASPWIAADVPALQFAQSADVLYIVHPNYRPRELRRTGATSFALSEIEFSDGPYFELNTTGTTMTPASRVSYTPLMTSNTLPSGTVSSSPASADAYKVFDGDPSSQVLFAGSTSGYIQYQRTAATVSDKYWVTAPPESTYADLMPKAWTVQGSNDGSTWTTLDTRKGETGWVSGETRFYDMPNTASYSYLRFEWTGAGSSSFSDTRIAEIGFNIAGDSQTAFNLTASAVTGINDDTGFQATDVRRPIRLLGSDGVWRWARIISRTSTTVVTIRMYGHSLPSTSAIMNWQLGAWSAYSGWPGAIGFYSGRLAFARTETQPQTVWLSVVDDFTNFGISDPLQDDDAINATIASGSLEEIKWLAEGSDLIIGTSVAIRTLGPTSAAQAFSPTNIQQRRQTNYGASSVQPARVGNVAVYSGYYRKDIREISYSWEQSSYISQDLSILAEHIPSVGVKELAYAQTPDSVVWMCMDDGSLAGMTYERDQDVVAFHRHSVALSDGVESVATIPGSASDELWMVVKRTLGGSTKRYIERLSIGLDDTEIVQVARYLDSFLTYLGTATATITGLDHLEGEAVYAWTSPGAVGPFVVTSGQITLPVAVGFCRVGLFYLSRIGTLSPEAGARGGTAQTRLGKSSEVFLRVNRSMGGRVGPYKGTMETVDYSQSMSESTGNYGSNNAMFTGDVRVQVAMEWDRQKRLLIEHADPSPFHLLGFISEMKVSG